MGCAVRTPTMGCPGCAAAGVRAALFRGCRAVPWPTTCSPSGERFSGAGTAFRPGGGPSGGDGPRVGGETLETAPDTFGVFPRAPGRLARPPPELLAEPRRPACGGLLLFFFLFFWFRPYVRGKMSALVAGAAPNVASSEEAEERAPGDWWGAASSTKSNADVSAMRGARAFGLSGLPTSRPRFPIVLEYRSRPRRRPALDSRLAGRTWWGANRARPHGPLRRGETAQRRVLQVSTGVGRRPQKSARTLLKLISILPVCRSRSMDLFGSQIQGDLIGVAQWRFLRG